MSYLCDLFFIFSPIFIAINHITSFKQKYLWLHVIIMSHTRFRVNLHSIVANELLARNRGVIWSLSKCNKTRTHNHLVRKQTLKHLAKIASLAKCLSVCLWTKCLWAQILFLLLKLQITLLFRARSSLTFRQL